MKTWSGNFWPLAAIRHRQLSAETPVHLAQASHSQHLFPGLSCLNSQPAQKNHRCVVSWSFSAYLQ